MLSLKAKIAASGLLAAAAVASGVGATPASAATETVTVTIQVTRNSVTSWPPTAMYGIGHDQLRCGGMWTPKPTFVVVAPRGETIYLYSVRGCYSGIAGTALVVADATKTVQVEL